MRKIIYISAWLCLTLLLASCETNEPFENLNENMRGIALSEDLILQKNPNSVIDYLPNENDPDDEKIRRQRYEMGLLVRDLFVDNTYNKELIDNAITKANTSICLQEFVSECKASKSGGDSKQAVFIKLQRAIESTDFTRRSTNPLEKGQIEEYIPALFLVNPETADYRKQPFISPGIEVDAELPGLEDFDNYIVAWISDENGVFQEVLIDEEFAMTTPHPIFSVDNAENEMTHSPKIQIAYKQPEPSQKNQQTAKYSTYEYRINHRYDKRSQSEFTITAARIDQDGNAQLPLRKSNGTVTPWKEIASVSKSDIGKDLKKWVQFCNEAPIPFDENFIFFNTYERDWWASDKTLGEATRNGTTIYLSGRRTNSGDWYAYAPGDVNDNPIDMHTVYHSWAQWHSNDKGHIRFWRIQP